MARKISEARREAYLGALAETGNLSIAAERAKVSLFWAKRLRKCDPEFAERFAAARDAARARLRDAASVAPPRGWGSLDGEELVVRPGRGRDMQIARARLKQWTPRAEARFIAVLAATCNVTAAAREVGMSPAAAYYHASRWPEFAKRWHAAIDEGYFRIEMELMRRAASPQAPAPTSRRSADADQETDEALGAARLAAMTDEDVFHQLYMHQHERRGTGKRPGRRFKPRPEAPDGALRVLLRNLDRIERRKRLGDLASDATRADDSREWDRRGVR